MSRELTPDVIAHILARLPAKTLLRFMCVCKPWASLIRDYRYLLSRRPDKPAPAPAPAPGFLSSYSEIDRANGGCTLNLYSPSDADGVNSTVHKFDLRPFLRRPGQGWRLYAVTNSCDGLVGIYDRYGNGFYVANPSIRKIRPLPAAAGAPRGDDGAGRLSGPFVEAAGLSYDASTGEYEAVRVLEYRRMDQNMRRTVEFRCDVFSFGGGGGGGGGGGEWKLVDGPPRAIPRRGFSVVLHEGALHYVDTYTESVVWPWPGSGEPMSLAPEGKKV